MFVYMYVFVCVCVCVCVCVFGYVCMYVSIYVLFVLYVLNVFLCWDRWMHYIRVQWSLQTYISDFTVALFMYCSPHIL